MPMPRGYEQYSDAVVAYHQYKNVNHLSDAEATQHKDTLEAFAHITSIVTENSELAVTYMSVFSMSELVKAEAISYVRRIEEDILDGLRDGDVITDGTHQLQKSRLAHLSTIERGARNFIRLFGSVISDSLLEEVALAGHSIAGAIASPPSAPVHDTLPVIDSKVLDIGVDEAYKVVTKIEEENGNVGVRPKYMINKISVELRVSRTLAGVLWAELVQRGHVRQIGPKKDYKYSASSPPTHVDLD